MVKNGTHYTCDTYHGYRRNNGQRKRACARCPLHDVCPQEGQVPRVACPSCGAAMEPIFVKSKVVPHFWEELLLSLRGQVVAMSRNEILGLGNCPQLLGFQCTSCHEPCNLVAEEAAKQLTAAMTPRL